MTLMPCRQCGYEVDAEASFCPACGAMEPGRQAAAPGPASGRRGFEYRSRTKVLGLPLVHVAFGRNEQGRFRVACGVVAIGQFAVGMVTVAQFGIGVVFGLGQVMFGLTAVAQVAVTLIFGVGQLAVGYVAIGQLVFAYYGLAQLGAAHYLWSPERSDPEAVELFRSMWNMVRDLF